MKKVILTLLLTCFVGMAVAQSSEGPTQIEIAATGIAEYYKKELKLTKEQYPKVKKCYLQFLTHQAYNPGMTGIGCEKLEKGMQKTLDEEQFKKWRGMDPNRPLTDAEKKKLKDDRKANR